MELTELREIISNVKDNTQANDPIWNLDPLKDEYEKEMKDFMQYWNPLILEWIQNLNYLALQGYDLYYFMEDHLRMNDYAFGIMDYSKEYDNEAAKWIYHPFKYLGIHGSNFEIITDGQKWRKCWSSNHSHDISVPDFDFIRMIMNKKWPHNKNELEWFNYKYEKLMNQLKEKAQL